MSEPIKENLTPDQPSFSEALADARASFKTFAGVLSVGFGQKHSAGQFRDQTAIIVYVQEKKNEEELAPKDRIPPEFNGYPTDVVVIPQASLLKCDNKDEYGTIQGGIQIVPTVKSDNGDFEEGTLGCIVRRRGDSGRENVYLLTCHHVLFNKKSGKNDGVYHPFAPPPRESIPRSGPSNYLGPIQPPPPVSFGHYHYTYTNNGVPTTEDFFIDCGTARINIDSKCCDKTCTKDRIEHDETITELQLVQVGANLTNFISDVRNVIGDPSITVNGTNKVFKVGRTTGRTVGLVRRIGGTQFAKPDEPNVQIIADNVLEIDFDTSTGGGVNCKGHAWFAEKGDSGSLVVDEQGRAIGLLFLGPAPGSAHAAPSYACLMVPVLDSLKVCIPTRGGTSYGSCGATDGSGLTSAGHAEADALPDGQIVFTSVGAANAHSKPLAEPVHLTAPEIQHMEMLLEEFRETRKGRELHDVFGEYRREIGYLVRNCRPVKVVWHRHQGPAFFAHVLNHLRGYSDEVPREVKGVSRELLLARMGEVLYVHGSNPLRQAIDQYSAEFMSVAGNLNSARDCIEFLRQRENS